MRVLIADKLAPQVARHLEAVGCAVTANAALKDDTLIQAIAEAEPHILVVRSTEVRAEHLEASPSLSLVIRAGAGVNNVDLVSASARGVYVSNCPGKNAVAVAELAFAHLLNCDRRLVDNAVALREGRWDKAEFGKALGLHGRKLAVLGVGRIGREVIDRALAFGMQVRAWSRSLTAEAARRLDVIHAVTPLEACRGAHALSIHLPTNEETRGLVGRELLDALAPGAYVINTARGEVLDQDALLRAIRSRGLRAGLDVFPDEPAGSTGEFTGAAATEPAIYGTHHIGASTRQAEEAVGEEVNRIVETFMASGRVQNCVNLARQTPATHLLVVRHRDEVGVLANVLDVLRKAGINVQEMENIIFQDAAAACARIHVDAHPARDILRSLEAAEAVFATSVIAL